MLKHQEKREFYRTERLYVKLNYSSYIDIKEINDMILKK